MDTQEPGDPLTSVEGRLPWVRWEYTPEEWHLFDQRDWHETMRMFKRSMQDVVRFYVVLAVFGVFLFFIFMMTGRIPSASPLLFGVEALGLAAVMALVIPIFAMTDLFQLLNAWKRHLARGKETRCVVIGNLTSSGKQTIWIGEQSVPLQNAFLRLSQAILYEDIHAEANGQSYQPELTLSRRLGPLNLSSIDDICVLVPRGHEKEARQLAERLNNETITTKRKAPR